MSTEFLSGQPVSSGIALGKAFLLGGAKTEKPLFSSVENEFARLKQAFAISQDEIKQKISKAAAGDEKAAIFEAHLQILEDPEWLDSIRAYVQNQKVVCEVAVEKACADWVQTFSAMEDPYFRERASDIRDLSLRVARNLRGEKEWSPESISEECILVVHELLPSVAGMLPKKFVKGVISEVGGKASHSAILLRNSEIPGVFGIKNLLGNFKSQQNIVMDAEIGRVYVEPDSDTIEEFKKRSALFEQEKTDLKVWRQKEVKSAKNEKIQFLANIAGVEDALSAAEKGAEGVGLFRTEFLYMDRTDLPSENEQYQVYKKVLETFPQGKVVIRTLDVGGDKTSPALPIEAELNPFMGLRGIRFCFAREDVFRAQIRALLRASSFGNLWVMFPMITNVAEVLKIKKIVEEEKQILFSKATDSSEKNNFEFKFGIMIEVPAAALIADELAKHVDFFSIGTNDLTQYTCAVDRMNDSVSDLYETEHPGVLKLLEMVIESGRKNNVDVGVCGEFAGEPKSAQWLVDRGCLSLSMNAARIAKVKKYIFTKSAT